MSGNPMTQPVGAAPPPQSAISGDSTTVSPRGRGSYIWTGPIQNLGATRKLTSETALVRALTLPVGAAPSPRSAVRGGSTTISAWGQASVVVDDLSSIQPRPTPCGCSYNPPCRSPALGAIVNGGFTPTLTLPPQGGGDSHTEKTAVFQLPRLDIFARRRGPAIHAITPSPLRGEGWGGGELPHLNHSTKAWAPALMGK